MEGHRALFQVEILCMDVSTVGHQVGIQRQRQVNVGLEIHPHGLADAADDRVEVIAVPEEAYALPIRRDSLLLGLQVGAWRHAGLVGRFGNAEGDVAGGGVVSEDSEDVMPVGGQEVRHVEAEGPHASLVIPAEPPVDVEIAGLPHALKGDDRPLAPVFRRYVQHVAVEGHRAGLTAACILDGHGKQLPVVERMGEGDGFPGVIGVIWGEDLLAVRRAEGSQSVCHGEDIGQLEFPALMEEVGIRHGTVLRPKKGAAAFTTAPEFRVFEDYSPREA